MAQRAPILDRLGDFFNSPSAGVLLGKAGQAYMGDYPDSNEFRFNQVGEQFAKSAVANQQIAAQNRQTQNLVKALVAAMGGGGGMNPARLTPAGTPGANKITYNSDGTYNIVGEGQGPSGEHKAMNAATAPAPSKATPSPQVNAEAMASLLPFYLAQASLGTNNPSMLGLEPAVINDVVALNQRRNAILNATVSELFENRYSEALKRRQDQATMLEGLPGEPVPTLPFKDREGQTTYLTPGEYAKAATARAAMIKAEMDQEKNPAERAKLAAETRKLLAETAKIPADMRSRELNDTIATLNAMVNLQDSETRQKNAKSVRISAEADKTSAESLAAVRDVEISDRIANARGDAMAQPRTEAGVKGADFYNNEAPDGVQDFFLIDKKNNTATNYSLPVIEGYQVTMGDVRNWMKGIPGAGMTQDEVNILRGRTQKEIFQFIVDVFDKSERK